MSRLVRRALLGTVTVLVGIAGTAVPMAHAATAPLDPLVSSERHCVVNVVGQSETGELKVTSPRCFTTQTEARASGSVYSLASRGGSGSLLSLSTDIWLATHYEDVQFGGSSLAIFGPSCSGWLNMSPSWNNRISSTLSDCATWHYDGFNRTGAVEMITAPGGDLTNLDNRTSSTQYT